MLPLDSFNLEAMCVNCYESLSIAEVDWHSSVCYVKGKKPINQA